MVVRRTKAWADLSEGGRALRVRRLKAQLTKPAGAAGPVLSRAERQLIQLVLPRRGVPPTIDLDAVDRFRAAAKSVLEHWLRRERGAEKLRDRQVQRTAAAAATATIARTDRPKAKREVRCIDDLAVLAGEGTFEERAAAVTDPDGLHATGDTTAGSTQNYDLAWFARSVGRNVRREGSETDEAYEARRHLHVRATIKDLADAVIELRVRCQRWPNAETVALLAVARTRFTRKVSLLKLETYVTKVGWLRQARSKRNKV